MNILKIVIVLSTLTGLSTSFAVSPRGPVVVEIENEGQSLAQGYAKAFDKFPPGAKYAIIKTQKGPQHITGSIRDIEAIEATLVIYIDNGPIHVVNPHDIVKITNEKPANHQ